MSSLGHIKIISAGAGSGKTYRLTEELTHLLSSQQVRASGIIATTFTKKAAAELKERVRVKLLEEGLFQEANELTNALIGTVHGLGVKLLQRFAFEAGVSPAVEIIPEEDHQRLFNLSMAAIIPLETIERLEDLIGRLGLAKSGTEYNWRREVREMVEVIRANDFSASNIALSRQRSWDTFAAFLPAPDERSAASAQQQLTLLLRNTIDSLTNNPADSTAKTQKAAQQLQILEKQLQRREQLAWSDWAKITKIKKEVGVKSHELVEELILFAQGHTALKAFQDDIRDFIFLLFDCARDTIQEYDSYKKKRGQIDYTDMEVLVLRLLEQPNVQATLREELDLLMVDEFQDTSPIQLALFLRLSQLAKQRIWVGDPKQSIYGFRGAEPALMAAVIRHAGGIRAENIQSYSWRSREDLVYASNAIFVRAFPEIPPQEVRLIPKRLKSQEASEEAERSALWHWHYELESGYYAKEWFHQVLARSIQALLANPPAIRPKGSAHYRPLQAGDIAVLCRSNFDCADMAQALEATGVSAALARTGLLQTAESSLLLAMLRYMLNAEDSLSAAEIMLLASGRALGTLLDDRLAYLEQLDNMAQAYRAAPWGAADPVIQQLERLRATSKEFSPTELINFLLEELAVRRIVIRWGKGEQRLSNLDELRRLAMAYEENCHRLQQAASVGGLLLYLQQLGLQKMDKQGAGESSEAVNVLTYHRSKGLEWPVVVCHNLDQDLKAELWGKTIISEATDIDPNDPLRDRWLRFWVNPYGANAQGLELTDRLAASEWQQQKTMEASAEEARLLYVGITRARDYLILPTAKKGAPWLDRVFKSGNAPVLDPHDHATPFVWEGHEIDKLTQTWIEARTLPSAEPSFSPTPFMAGARKGRQPHPPLAISAEQMQLQFPKADARAAFTYYPTLSLSSSLYQAAYGKAMATFLSSHQQQLSQDEQRKLADEIILRFGLSADAQAANFLAQGQAFEEWLHHHYPASERQKLLPIRLSIGEQRYENTLDLWLHNAKDRVLVQHCLLPSPKWEKKVRKELAAFYYLAWAAQQALPGGITAAFIHLPIQAVLIPIPLTFTQISLPL